MKDHLISQQLVSLREEIMQLEPRASSREFTSWRERTNATLTRAIGEDNIITRRFQALQWTSRIGTEVSPVYINHFKKERDLALGLLDAAISEIESQQTRISSTDHDSIDADLWAFVRSDVEAESWGKSVNQACLYLEDRVRHWAARPPEEVGERLMTTVFGDSGVFRLGATEAEKHGWHRYGMGIFMAARNVYGHRLQDRPDHKMYAMGVIYSCSLLITQLKFEHAEEFQ